MIDRLMSRGAIKRDVLSTPDYRPSDVIKVRHLSNPNNCSRLAVLLPPWHGGGKAYEVLSKRLLNHQLAVLSYSFHDQLLKPNVQQVLDSFAVIQQTVTQELAVQASHFDEIHLISSSLGCVSLALIAEKFRDFDSATVVTGASDLAVCTWEGSRTQRIRQILEKNDTTEEQLVEAWQSVAPINHVQAFEDKAVRLIISTSDDIIPARSQEEFAGALAAVNGQTTVERTRLGHLATIGRYCLTGPLP